ncbi:lipid A export permease/ATP-binding protein MsbA [Crenobacter caeni]|uniref:Lipid A export permease/ATP-binding protein MsbA n=1 Tax=Crenobacter caeni TaxID=2705474 RepID=A0A6B2KTN8_9NEIS|nr:lipid A export permease/ATP-binding protein MsbA [Crenobacter caeni]NDV13474.1 lipid A export permease/ATP-binding protein MsbA [Crenobacter caeni]
MSASSFKESLALYRRVMRYLLPHWKIFTVSTLAMVVAAATEPAFASLMKPLIDGGFVEKSREAIIWTPLAIVGLFVVRGVATYVNEYASAWLTGQLVERLRTEMFERMQTLPMAYFDAHPSGNTLSRIVSETTQVSDAGFNVITVTVKDGLTIVGLLGLLLYTDWRLALICFAVMPVVAVCVRYVSSKLRKLSRKNRQDQAQMTQIVSEVIACQSDVRVYQGEAQEMHRFGKSAEAMRRNQIKRRATNAASTGITQLLIAVALAVILYFAGVLAQTANFSAGDFMSFLTAMLMLFAPLKRITGISQNMQRGLAAAESVFEFLDQTPERDTGSHVLQETRGELTLRDVSFFYPGAEHPALDGISLEIRAGETLALVGASGSGKTTLASLLARFHEPTAGEILLDGRPLREYTLASLRSQIALVSQNVALFDDTIAANIAYGRTDVSQQQLVEAARAANALEFIEALPDGFATVIGEDGSRLSGGQRQRLAIARAILKNAPILILDEATSALDTQSERLVQSALENLMRGRTTVVIAHRLSTIERADRIVVMERGRMVESGAHLDLMARGGIYAHLQKHSTLPSVD